MDKQTFLEYISAEVDTLLKETQLANYKNQVFAWRLNAEFQRNYKSDYLWNRAIFLATNCALLLQNNGNSKLVTGGLKNAAEIFEYLSELTEITEHYDPDYILLLSAMCYDLAGYQANAYCIATKIGEFSLVDNSGHRDLSSDNYIVWQITNILLKKLPLAQAAVNDASVDEGILLFNDALHKWFENIFKLENTNYLESFELVYKHYLNKKNVFISHLLFLLQARIAVYNNRSLWLTVKGTGDIATNQVWRKYIKLLAYDYYNSHAIKDIEDRKSIFELWTSQLRALEHGLLDLDENFVVQMPTSAGKTFIAELSILKYLTNFPDKKCIYIAPFRALTSEKEIELSKYFSKLGYSVSALSGSYEVDSFQDVILSQTDVLIATPEKIDMLLRVNPEIFNEISLMVVDEGHIIGEISSRATLLEFLIIRLKIKLPDLATLFISAVMPPQNANEYSLWLSGKQENVLRSLQFPDSSLTEEWEPTRKLIGSFTWENSNGMIGFKNFEEQLGGSPIGTPFIPNFLKGDDYGKGYPKIGNKPLTTAALAYKLSYEGNTLVFCSQPRFTENISSKLLDIITKGNNEIPDWFKSDSSKESYFYSKMWYGEDYYISKAIKRGIGIHFGDMPEQVRSSVEQDYRNGKLKVLLASNTVGQGLNFPIKNLIFYSLNIGYNDGMINISNRDFWNIIGRAGRAGKETEGKIIFIINSWTDLNLYRSYINKDNIEPANSLLYKVMEMYYDERISKETKNKHIATLSETYLLDLFTEEIVGTEFEEIINNVVGNSLFKVQIEKDGNSLKPIKKAFKKIFRSFEQNLSHEEAATYKLSGFSYSSNKKIDTYVTENLERLREIFIEDNYISLLSDVFNFILTSDIEELEDQKLKDLKLTVKNHFPIIEKWVTGVSLEEIIDTWNEKYDIANFHILLSKGLFYLYPWAMTAFLNILSFRLKYEANNIPENIKNLTSYLKYGLNDATGCLARSLGIKNRDVVNILLPLSNYRTGSSFIKWLSNLSVKKIEQLEISDFDKENIINVSRRLTAGRFSKIPDDLRFQIEGTADTRLSRLASLRVTEGDQLSYRRRNTSSHSASLIYLYSGRLPVGHIPAEYVPMLGAEIDINETEFLITVHQIIDHKDYRTIIAELQEIKSE